MKTIPTTELELTAEVEAMLATVRPYTQGKRILLLGGEPRPDKIARFMAALQPGQLIWPDHNPRKGVLDHAAKIERADLVLLFIECMGHRLSDRRHWRKFSTPMVRVTGSFGVVRIIQALHQFLLGKDLTNDHARARGTGRKGRADERSGLQSVRQPSRYAEDEAPGRQPPDRAGMSRVRLPPLRWGVRPRSPDPASRRARTLS